MSDSHQPIDHKDDSPAYREQVWRAVSQRVNSDLTPLPADTLLDGTWNVELEMMGNRLPFAKYEFDDGSSVSVTLTVQEDGPTSLVPYHIPDEGRFSLDGEIYHAAMTTRDELVLFNGDQSLVLVATKP